MPQFVPNGPIVPDKLVQDLEDDRLVIFCGAGISMGAGLPNFRGLVEHCFRELSHPLPAEEDGEWDWPDRMLGVLESRYGTEILRKTVAERLNRRPHSLAIHRAILRLARMRRHEGLRLVTTNFDTFFEKACKTLHIKYPWHAGPVLPIPRNDHTSSWRSLVYLHGRLGDPITQSLVLTSADFGRAYLTDAWASRFVTRLFSDFTVLFVGYSLNDPVLRYMIDAFAAEDAEARFTQPRDPAYILIPSNGEATPDLQLYRDRNLEPIFYNAKNNHLVLRQTLIAWADARDDYLANTATLINGIAPTRPDAIDPTDTSNLLWAVMGRPDDNGHGARVFSEVGDLPPIDWLDAFEQREHELLLNYETARKKAKHADRRPPLEPTFHIGPLFPDALDARENQLSPKGLALIGWLIRHLGTEGFAERVLAKMAVGRRLHPQLRHAIRTQLGTKHDLRAGYVRFWRIISAEGEWSICRRNSTLGPAWTVRNALNVEIDPAWLKQELLAALRPTLDLSPSPYRRWRDAIQPGTAEERFGDQISHIVEAEVNLTGGDHVNGMIAAFNMRPNADAYWANLLDDLTSLLRQALDLYAVVDKATESTDLSTLHRPSIVPHEQNDAHSTWTLLFDLIWRGWAYIDGSNAELSRSHVTRWRQLPYIAFRRIVLAAMNHSRHFSPEERTEVLLNG